MTPLLWLIFAPDLQALGAADFQVRCAAEARLSRHADLCWPMCAYPYADPERRRRARRVLAQAVPQSYPPVALLCGQPLAEWVEPGAHVGFVGARPCEGDMVLGWLCPDRSGGWLKVVVQHYGERARQQTYWRDWHSDQDGREATRLLCADLLALGVPAPLVRRLVDVLRQREAILWAGRGEGQ